MKLNDKMFCSFNLQLYPIWRLITINDSSSWFWTNGASLLLSYSPPAAAVVPTKTLRLSCCLCETHQGQILQPNPIRFQIFTDHGANQNQINQCLSRWVWFLFTAYVWKKAEERREIGMDFWFFTIRLENKLIFFLQYPF